MRRVFQNLENIFKNLRKNPVDSRLVGRWSVDHNEESVFRRADLTNEDHCGVCSEIREKYVEKQAEKEKEVEKERVNLVNSYQFPFII